MGGYSKRFYLLNTKSYNGKEYQQLKHLLTADNHEYKN